MAGEETTHDVVILGGGPAGATACRLLCQWGHRPLLVTRPRPASQAIAESLPPSVRRLLSHLGIEDDVDSAGFLSTTGNTVWWGGDAAKQEPRVERFESGATGFQVRARELERVLLGSAKAAGAEMLLEHRVASVRGLDREGRAPAVVEIEAPGGESLQVRASWVLDATGRGGVVARRGLRRPVEGRATLSLLSRWSRAGGFDLPEPSHTLVESYADGWAWSVPVSPEERHVAVMVDPRHTALTADGGRESMAMRELQKTRALRRLVEDATRVGAVLACDASMYTAHRFCGEGFFLVGDAGSFIDPLSSYGVKKAMASGWLASVCVHTCLRRPELRAAALELYDRREKLVFESHARLAARHFGEGGKVEAPGAEVFEAEVGGAGFWQERSDHDAGEIGLGGGADVAALRRDPAVLAAFDELKRRPRIRLREATDVCREKLPVVSGNEVALAEHLVCPGRPKESVFSVASSCRDWWTWRSAARRWESCARPTPAKDPRRRCPTSWVPCPCVSRRASWSIIPAAWRTRLPTPE